MQKKLLGLGTFSKSSYVIWLLKGFVVLFQPGWSMHINYVARQIISCCI